MKVVSPKEYMRQRRPENFSDSKVIKVAKLNRTLLEYHLESLTSRKQEYEFEEFARKLCEYEICPGLRPQTGPAGGGDGKVDTETIPKAKELSDLYYVGLEKSTKEDWAFAFSAKKDWVGKAKSDIKKITETGRGYKKIFFVTSRYAKSSKRSEIEDSLSKELKTKVLILDRTWILDNVFGNKREKLAIDELKLEDGLEEQIDVGPLDFQKEKRIKELSDSVEQDVVNGHINLKTIDNALSQAILTAQLEKPKSDVIGSFDRAINFAEKYGTQDQQFTSIYQKAWASFFWLEDFNAFIELYEEVEAKALISNNIFSTERLVNLWTLLFTLHKTQNMLKDDKVLKKTKNLKEKLDQFRKDTSAQSASVQAEVMSLLMNISLSIDNEEEISKTFLQLQGQLEKANLLIGFPFETTFQMLNEMDDIFVENKEYEKLQERIIEITTKRDGDIAAANMLYNRGLRSFESGKFYKSISLLGKALFKFYKKESKNDLVRTLFLLSMAYEEAGLLWAARGILINAASYATSDFWLYSKVNRMQTICYERLRTIELRLGNIGYALEWHRLNHVMSLQLVKSEEDRKQFLEKNLHFGSILGLLLIKTADKDLKKLEYLPDLLFSLDLDFAAYAVIFRLGCHDLFPKEFVKGQSQEEIQKFFDSFLNQPAQDYLPPSPDFYEGKILKMKSRILGCEFIVEVSNESPEIELGEYFLGALESFLATSMSSAVSRDQQISITIEKDHKQKELISYEVRNDNKLGLKVICNSFNPHKLTLEEQSEMGKSFSEAVIQLVAQSVIFQDPKEDLTKLFRDEEVSHRAFNFSSPLVTLGNLLGYKPQRSIESWVPKDFKKYPYIPTKSGKPKPIIKEEKPGDIKFNREDLRHNEVKNASVIRMHLWDEAVWRGVMYVVPPDSPPILSFMFDNEKAAKAIFEDWIDKFSRVDKDEMIRVSMLRGVSIKNPSWYKAVVGINLEKEKFSGAHLIVASRVHVMTPTSTKNLDNFSESFNVHKKYLLAPAIVSPQKPFPDLIMNLGIVKTSFNDRQAWEVGKDDIDMGGILVTDDIVIPEGKVDAPVKDLIEWKKSKNKS